MGALNMNMNMNMNMAAGILAGSGGSPTRVRYNSQDWWKYINVGDLLVPGSPGLMNFPANWDADLRSYIYLAEFLNTPGMGGVPAWQAKVDLELGPLVPPHLDPNLETEIQGILTVALDREDRFLEIIDQHQAEGAISYFSGMLMADPSRYPQTNLLIHAARRVGEHVVMCLKEKYRCPRPSQLCAGIVPMIDPPCTPSFPSGHSLQAQLIYRCLAAATPPMQPAHLLADLADRIGRNRIIAGLHFPKDHTTGQAVADVCFPLLRTGTNFGTLLIAATDELKSLS